MGGGPVSGFQVVDGIEGMLMSPDSSKDAQGSLWDADGSSGVGVGLPAAFGVSALYENSETSGTDQFPSPAETDADAGGGGGGGGSDGLGQEGDSVDALKLELENWEGEIKKLQGAVSEEEQQLAKMLQAKIDGLLERLRVRLCGAVFFGGGCCCCCCCC